MTAGTDSPFEQQHEREKNIPSVDITRIPIGEGWFTPSHALTTSKKSSITSGQSSLSSEALDTSSPTGSSPVNNVLSAQLASLTAAQTQMQMILSMGQMSNTIQGSVHLRSPSSLIPSHSHVRSSSPTIPMDSLSCHDFCVTNRFDKIVKDHLKALEFEPGDNLKEVLKEDWIGAGFTKLSWDRIVKANTQYR